MFLFFYWMIKIKDIDSVGCKDNAIYVTLIRLEKTHMSEDNEHSDMDNTASSSSIAATTLTLSSDFHVHKISPTPVLLGTWYCVYPTALLSP